MGFRYGKSNVIGKMNDTWYVARIRAFLIQYSAALQAEARGECVLVYTDESFVNVNHSRKSTWYSPLAPEDYCVMGLYETFATFTYLSSG